MSAVLDMQDRQVIAALLGSGVVAEARKTLRRERAQERREARAKLAGADALADQITSAAAKVVTATQARDEAQQTLIAAQRQYASAYFELSGLEQSRDGIRNAVEATLGRLADERCQPVDLWLAGLRTLANGAVRTWQEPRMRPLTMRGFFGIEEHSVSQLVDVSNIELVKQATSALDALRLEIATLVREFDGDDIGVELHRIKGEALAALKPLVESAYGVRQSDVPLLEIAE